MRRWLLVVAMGLIVGACGGNESPTSPAAPSAPSAPSVPSAPAAPNISGTWRGTARSSIFAGASVNIAATLTQTGASISGTYACSPAADCDHSSGTITGAISGNSLTAQVAFPDGHSCGAFNGALSGNTLSGNYSCTDPRGNDQGSWTMTKQ